MNLQRIYSQILQVKEFFKIPKYYYKISLNSKSFNKSQFICEGEQLALILSTLSDLITDYQWIIGDLSYNYNDPELHLPCKPLLFENSEKFTNYATKVQQFLSGVFLGGPAKAIEQIN